MSIKMIQERLDQYKCSSVQEEDFALREITQEIALMSLSRNGFFKHAAFHGGTSLRILYGMNRFSEDMDFILMKPDSDFAWGPFIRNMAIEFQAYGFRLAVLDQSDREKTIKKVLLKENLIYQTLSLHEMSRSTRRKKIRVRLEIDINPPAGSSWATRQLDFPLPYAVAIQDRASSFALKNHALLCREYVKGRDWYDFIWYITHNYKINFTLLKNAVKQSGPWEKQDVQTGKDWYYRQMKKKIENIDWKAAKNDVSRFLKPDDLITLEQWNTGFFLSYLSKLMENLPD